MKINLDIDTNNIETSFLRIATELMNEWVLIVKENKYRIAEIEFYLNHKNHEDSYTHSHHLQKESGKWYIHGSGMDITFGSSDFYGGILIRSLHNLSDPNEYIYGPINCLTEVFKGLGEVYKSEIAFGFEKDIHNLISFEKPIAALRVGLNKSLNQVMHDNFYRFLVLPKMKHSEKSNIEKAMRVQGYEEGDIKQIWG